MSAFGLQKGMSQEIASSLNERLIKEERKGYVYVVVER
jgi:hypothetical protein